MFCIGYFECAAYTYNTSSVAETEKDFQATLEKCQLITAENCRKFGMFKKMIGRVLRIIAPLM